MPRIGRKGVEWMRVREHVLRGATICQMPRCHYPGQPLDKTSVVNGRPGPLYPTVEHKIPVSLTEGWSDEEKRAALHDPRYLVPAHLGCNAARGNRLARARPAGPPPTRDWGV